MTEDEFYEFLDDLTDIAHAIKYYNCEGLTVDDAESILQAEQIMKSSLLWTLVKDEYPENGQFCLITVTMAYDGRSVEELATYHCDGDGNNGYWALKHDIDYNEVTAWRPAPKPYKRDKKYNIMPNVDEKLQAKKVIKSGSELYSCPSCGNCFRYSAEGDFKPNYCPWCGQKLDWSDVNLMSKADVINILRRAVACDKADYYTLCANTSCSDCENDVDDKEFYAALDRAVELLWTKPESAGMESPNLTE